MTEIKEWWGAVVAAVGVVVWLVRLEGGTKLALRELRRLEAQMETHRQDSRTARQETNEILREMQRDIKMLLGRGSVIHWDDKTRPPP